MGPARLHGSCPCATSQQRSWPGSASELHKGQCIGLAASRGRGAELVFSAWYMVWADGVHLVPDRTWWVLHGAWHGSCKRGLSSKVPADERHCHSLCASLLLGPGEQEGMRPLACRQRTAGHALCYGKLTAVTPPACFMYRGRNIPVLANPSSSGQGFNKSSINGLAAGFVAGLQVSFPGLREPVCYRMLFVIHLLTAAGEGAYLDSATQSRVCNVMRNKAQRPAFTPSSSNPQPARRSTCHLSPTPS